MLCNNEFGSRIRVTLRVHCIRSFRDNGASTFPPPLHFISQPLQPFHRAPFHPFTSCTSFGSSLFFGKTEKLKKKSAGVLCFATTNLDHKFASLCAFTAFALPELKMHQPFHLLSNSSLHPSTISPCTFSPFTSCTSFGSSPFFERNGKAQVKIGVSPVL